MLRFYRALSALVALKWKIQGVGSIISPSTVRIVIVGVQPRFAVRGSLPSNIGRDVIGSPQHSFPAIATLATVAWGPKPWEIRSFLQRLFAGANQGDGARPRDPHFGWH